MQLLKVYPDRPDEKAVRLLVSLLKRNEVLVIPTATGYAYACHALEPKAIDRIYQIKGYSDTKRPLAVLCLDIAEASKYCRIDDEAFRIIRKHQGRYTFVLPALSKLPKSIKDRKEIGLRLASHPVERAILSDLQAPLILASIPTEEDEEPEYITNPELIAERNTARHLNEQAALIVDAGIIDRHPSTIIDCSNGECHILREGE
ncbi:MAG: L-threonylcarbamoyladenylate synthase [Porphyromonas sp.]|nr:L-threonylcarbamoyladenylate synthase [Porphyromonas sp.]